MVQLSQLVLLASIIASCISYSTSKAMSVPEPPAQPPKDLPDFPTEFMEKLIASLTPAELKELQKVIDLEDDIVGHRDGNKDKGLCDKYKDTPDFYEVTATDNEHYYVVNLPYKTFQPVNHFLCNDKMGNRDHGNSCGQNNATSAYCCRQGTKITSLRVYPEPTRNFVRIKGKLYPNGKNVTHTASKFIEKDVELNSDCFCDEYKSGLAYFGRKDFCPLSDSSEYKEQ